MKKYRAIFFDWDGTAVSSRSVPADKAIAAMKPLLKQGIKLVIVSGTTIENIAGGHIESFFTPDELQNLYLGLGRGAYNYAFDEEGKPYIFENEIPEKQTLLDIHKICFDIHMELLDRYDFATDVVFSRPNYCKIDLMVYNQRGDNLYLQASELDMLKESLEAHNIHGGLKSLIELSMEVSKRYGINTAATCDAKYLEVGISSKSDNVDTILKKICNDSDISPEECAYWGDEYVGIEAGIFGSDSYMITEQTAAGDFFDVSEVEGERPVGVEIIGGGVNQFIKFLLQQVNR